jgi:single-strand DNA-binding protein
MNLNRVFLAGHLTRDPEVRSLPKGGQVADLGLAINRVYSTEGGEKKEETTFVDVTLWGRQAEIAGQYLSKGRAIFIEGRLQLDSWDDRQTGQKRTRLKVICESLQFLPNRAETGKPSAAASVRAVAAVAPQPGYENDDRDVLF